MPFNRVSLGFAQLPDSGLSEFYVTVNTSLTGNASFPNPPSTPAALAAAGDTFIAKLAAAANGGKLEIAEKNVARAALVAVLRQLASYVQTVAGDNLPVLLSSGFLAVSTSTAQTPLPKPVIENIDNFQSTKLMMRLKSMANYRAIEGRRRQGNGDWQSAGIYTQLRKIVQENLVPGQTYDFQFRAIGGSTGYSDWSDPVSHMAT